MEETDVLFEEDVSQRPEDTDNWLRYIQHLNSRSAPRQEQWLLYERALLIIPISFKLWKMYLDDRVEVLTSSRSFELFSDYELLKKEVSITNGAFERALNYLPLCIRIYLDYAHFLLSQRKISKMINVLDKALKTLPILQHHRIWQLYVRVGDFLGEKCPLTRHLLWKRYLKLEPSVNNYIKFVDVCIEAKLFDEAAFSLEKLAEELDVENSQQHLMRLSNLVIECPPTAMPTFPVDDFLRKMIEKCPKMHGQLWSTLGTFYVRIGDLEKAESIFEEALVKVIGSKDFAQVFEAYAKLEETMLILFENGTDGSEGDESESIDFEFLEKTMNLLNSLIERRPLLLVEARLRQFPNKIPLWLKKIEIVKNSTCDDVQIERTFEEAMLKINDKKYSPHQIYLEFAKYKKEKSIDFKELLEGAKSCHREAAFWIEWSLLVDNINEKMEILKKGCKRNLKNRDLWIYYLDFLESSFYNKSSTEQDVTLVYEEMADNKIVTVDHFVNYACFLQMTRNVEIDDSILQIYHRGIQHFGYPTSFELWNILLPKAVNYWGENKFERVRELFEEALKNCPLQYIHSIYVLYGDAEEKHGLARNAIHIYQRAALAGGDSIKRIELFNLAINKAKKLIGPVGCRPIFEAAISPQAGLLDHQARHFVLEFAGLEVMLGEIDRARTLFGYGAQLADPTREEEYWKKWNEFEVKNGDETSFREMLRVKRAVQAKFDQNPYFVRSSKQ